jgi:hypothetical protein
MGSRQVDEPVPEAGQTVMPAEPTQRLGDPLIRLSRYQHVEGGDVVHGDAPRAG